MESHPYFQTYTDYQKEFTYFNTQHLGNNVSTKASITSGEFPLNSGYRYACGFMPSETYLSFFSKENIKYMSRLITEGLAGLHPENKNIIVPDDTIRSVADSVNDATSESAQVMQQMTVNYIIDNIKTEYANTAKNNAYTPWVQRYDQETGLKQFNDIKLNNKMRSAYMQWRY